MTTRLLTSLSIPLSVVLALLVASCGGSSSSGTPATDSTVDTDTPTDSDSATDADADDVTDSGSAALSCTSPDVEQEFYIAYFDAPDFEAFEDLFVPDFDAEPNTPQEWATFSAVPSAGAAFLGIQGEPLYILFELAACNYELYAENRCQTPLLSVDSASMDAGSLTFIETHEDASVSVTITDSQYTSGILQRFNPDGTTWDMAWSRDSDGTERFNSFNSDGASSEFIEYSDCSGTANRVMTTSEGEPASTMSAEWSSPTGSQFSATFEWCDTVEDVVQCDTFTRP